MSEVNDLYIEAAKPDHPLHDEWLRMRIRHGKEARDELKMRAPMKPMVSSDAFSSISDSPPAVINIVNPNHFMRTLRFVDNNNLQSEFYNAFHSLMLLMTYTGGRIYPDGPNTPDFGWQGAGMYGGFIFSPDTRTWSIHT
jgi:hypothetical protein